MRTEGSYDPQIRTQPRFLYSAPTPKFHPMFTRSEVIVLTNKQTDAAENIQSSSLRYDVGYYYFSLRRRPSEIILFRQVETSLKLFDNYFRGLLQLINISQHIHCR